MPGRFLGSDPDGLPERLERLVAVSEARQGHAQIPMRFGGIGRDGEQLLEPGDRELELVRVDQLRRLEERFARVAATAKQVGEPRVLDSRHALAAQRELGRGFVGPARLTERDGVGRAVLRRPRVEGEEAGVGLAGALGVAGIGRRLGEREPGETVPRRRARRDLGDLERPPRLAELAPGGRERRRGVGISRIDREGAFEVGGAALEIEVLERGLAGEIEEIGVIGRELEGGGVGLAGDEAGPRE